MDDLVDYIRDSRTPVKKDVKNLLLDRFLGKDTTHSGDFRKFADGGYEGQSSTAATGGFEDFLQRKRKARQGWPYPDGFTTIEREDFDDKINPYNPPGGFAAYSPSEAYVDSVNASRNGGFIAERGFSGTQKREMLARLDAIAMERKRRVWEREHGPQSGEGYPYGGYDPDAYVGDTWERGAGVAWDSVLDGAREGDLYGGPPGFPISGATRTDLGRY